MQPSVSPNAERGHDPPGTVLLQDLTSETDGNGEVLLQPQPTDDPNDPLNWKKWEKSLNFGLVLLYCLLMMAWMTASTPTWGPMNIELGFSYETLTNSYAVGSAGLAISAIPFIPLALKFGRRPIYLGSLIIAVPLNVWAARISNVVDLFLFSLFNCALSALAESIPPMTIADVYFVHQRGSANSLYTWISVMGISLATVASGYISLDLGWRWVWWISAIMMGAVAIAFAFFYEDTKYAVHLQGTSPMSNLKKIDTESVPVDGDKKTDAEGQTATHGLWPVRSCGAEPLPPRKSYVQRLKLWTTSEDHAQTSWKFFWHPFVIMATFPAVSYTALVYAVSTSCYQVIVTVISSVMLGPPYLLSSDKIGLLSGIPFLIGATVGGLVTGLVSDRFILWLARRNNGVYEPEMRLWLLLFLSPLMPAALLLFGYSLNNGRPWFLVGLGAVIFASGFAPTLTLTLAYITDAYTDVIADSMVAITFARNAVATAFIFASTPWIEAVGIDHVFLTLALVCVACIVPIIPLLIFGKRIRSHTAAKYKTYSGNQTESRPLNVS
ncbi:major facilitator superfamily domain-containing protein [Dactylonectria macrodidyma]|uniref:Major facilitator superfamily domain-containing protein n=1 Tax=Dactylonectria macrodidyma TaxID=307937 RepID=A0A9P9J1I1_9HYPO|nr:major facilitator superfamily domain-containing protein [Dactylonectria macrodidyma]